MSNERKKLGRASTAVALLSAPLAIVWLQRHGHSLATASLLALVAVAATRGLVDLAFRKLVEQPSLYGIDDPEALAEDALHRRRIHFWKKKWRLAVWLNLIVTGLWLVRGGSWVGTVSWIWESLGGLASPSMLAQLVILPIFFLFNFVILMGPMMAMGISQMHGYEPGDAEWGVKLADVRGQKEAKEEISKVITLWQSGDKFVAAGGKRERGLLFLGAPGTGKTMLAKAIATGFNCPLVTMPGSGFAQTFIGMDVVITRYMARKARKLAAKWGGQCIVFIDEIDAVGMRRSSLGNQFHNGSENGQIVKKQMPGGAMFGGMGGMAINSLLVIMDGIDNPPFFRKVLTNKVNLYLDALYIIPRKCQVFGGKNLPLRLPRAKPTGNQIFFVGATNVPLEALDPALVRPGRLGRHIYFRTPTLPDREDIFDLYLAKVAHEEALDEPSARTELARVTNGYSPAQIEQVCSMALTYAQHEGREVFGREDILEAMVTVEAGTAIGWDYVPEEEKQIAIHEAGHAVTAHIFKHDQESTRLSVKRRGSSGGHLMTVDKDERFVKFRGELFGDLICTLGAHAAEYVFYGQNTQGVGGDLQQASHLAAVMVGRWGMTPPTLPGTFRPDDHSGIRRKLQDLGNTLMAVANPGESPMGPTKTAAEARMLGQAYTIAWHTIQQNKMAVEKIANALVDRKEIYGNDLIQLLEGCSLEEPSIDWSDAAVVPTL